MAEPFELLAVPFDVYLADPATAKPDIDDVTLTGWTLLGTHGADEYDEAGITVTHDQTVEYYYGLRPTGPVKAWRTREGLMLAFTLNDLTLASYGKMLNDVTPTDLGISKAITLHQGPQVAQFALLARSADGPYGDGFPAQYYVPKVVQSGSPAVVHKKGSAAGLALVFMALEDLDAQEDERFGFLEAQDVAGS